MSRSWPSFDSSIRSVRRKLRARREAARRARRPRVERLEGRALLAVGDLLDLRQFGGSAIDEASGLAMLDGYRYVAGFTTGALPGQTALGGAYDGFLRKYDLSGDVLWTKQFGTAGTDYVYDIAAADGAIYVVGFIDLAAFPGQTAVGGGDAFVRKYDTNGNELWTRQFGTSAYDSAYSLAIDSSGVYVGGETAGVFAGQSSLSPVDGWVRKFDLSGNVVWTHQVSTDGHDSVFGLVAHSSGLYVTGRAGNGTNGAFPGFTNPGGFDGFVRKYTLAGSGGMGVPVWTQQFGSSLADEARRVVADANGIYVVGGAGAALPGATSSGGKDAFVRKYDFSGSLLWSRQFGTSGNDDGLNLTLSGNELYVAATVGAALPGQVASGLSDIALAKFDTSGNEISARQFGTSGNDSARAIALVGDSILLAGGTEGTLPGGGTFGATDAFIATLDATPADGDFAWKRSIGTSGTDEIEATFAVGADTYVGGGTTGALPGFTNAGDRDALLRKYDAAGAIAWTSQFGTSGFDRVSGVVADSSAVYVAGHTFGAFPGFTNAGAYDGFLRRYDTTGAVVWTRQFGSPGTELAGPITMDATGVYVVGETTGVMPGQASAGGSDVFVVKYDFNGNLLWTRQFGTAGSDLPGQIGVHSSGVYIPGFTSGTFSGQTNSGGNDAFVREYDAAGNELWTSQFGTSASDSAGSIAVDETGVYVGGATAGTLPGATSAGGQDAFIRKYSHAGTPLWLRQFGSSGDEGGRLSIAADGVYAALGTTGTFAGLASSGGRDIAVLEFDRTGTERWRRQFGTTLDDFVASVSTSSAGPVVAFSGTGALVGQNNLGGVDSFLTQLRDARTVTWTNPAGGDWNTATNWDLAVVPTNGDRVVLPDLGTNGPSVTVTYASGATNLASLIGGEHLVVAGGALTVDSASAFAGDIQLSGGSFKTNDRLVGRPTNGLIGFWSGEGNALDSAGAAPGAMAGGTSFATGRFGQAFSFDGSNDQVTATVSSPMNGSFTIAMWINPSTIANSPVIFEKGSTPANRIGLQITSSGQVGGYFDSGSYSVLTSPGLVPLNQYTHVAFAFDDATNTAQAYVNGVLMASSPEFRTPLGNSIPLYFGRQNPAIGPSLLVGRLDEVAVFQRALSGGELAALMTPSLDVQAGSTWSGSGTIHGSVVNGGTVAPGSSPGILVVEGNYAQTGTLAMELQGVSATNPDFDQLVVNGTVTLAGTLDVNLLGGFQPTLGASFQIVTNDGTDAVSGTFAGLSEGAQFFVDQTAFSISYIGGTGNDVVLTVTRVPLKVTTTSDIAAGGLDTTFGAGTGRTITSVGAQSDSGEGGAIQGDGKLVVVGSTGTAGAYDLILSRFNSDGTLDTSFDGDGKVTTNHAAEDVFADIAVQPADQKLVVVGRAGSTGHAFDFATFRYTTSGALDTTFDGDGKRTDDFGGYYDAAYDLAVQPDGRIVVVGEMHTGFETNLGILRYLPNGSLDPSFGSGGKVTTSVMDGDQAFAVALQPDGKIIVAGRAIAPGDIQYVSVVRYNTDGSLDTTFDGDGKVTFQLNGQNSYANDVVVLPNGKVLVAVYTILGGLGSIGLVRLQANGAFDTTFDGDGVNVITLAPSGIAPTKALPLSDGRVIVAGYTHIGPNNNMVTLRFDSDGALDLGYGANGIAQTDLRGTADFASDAALDSNERVVLFGRAMNLAGTKTDLAVARVAGTGSLRQALQDANALANINGVPDSILFDIPGVGPHTITPLTSLPTITDAVTIDGWSEPDYAGTPVIELNGLNAGVNNGLSLSASNSTIRGLTINRFGFSGITLNPGANGNTITGNYIGTDVTGTIDLGNARYGIDITRAGNNTVSGNLISGNNDYGIIIASAGTNEASNNLVIGNKIGTNAGGTAAIPNNGGVLIQRASNNTIGGTGPSNRNIISGNNAQGLIIQGPDANGNVVRGNFVGLDGLGNNAIPNQFQAGIVITTAAQGTIIGGSGAGEGNVVSGNLGTGILVAAGAHHNVIAGNLVGTDSSGLLDRGNSQTGVRVEGGSHHNTIGGAAVGDRNVVSGNEAAGVEIVSLGSTDNLVAGNYIGTDLTGLADLGNSQDGVRVFGEATNNVVGGSSPALRNVISGNNGRGVLLSNAGTTGNQVLGNYLGVDATGSGLLGNSLGGVFFFVDASGNTIGGRAPGEGNVIAGNGGQAISTMSVAGQANAWAGNAMFSNSGLGIDVGSNGVTLNDVGDVDGDQNFPTIGAAVTNGASRMVAAVTLQSVASTSFTLDFFASSAADPSGYGEGQRYLGSTTASTDGTGNLSLVAELLSAVAPGEQLTATATRVGGGTSEFSQAAMVLPNQPPIAESNGPYNIFLGADAALNGSGSYDPNAAAGDSIVSYAWDLDNDGQYDDWTSSTPITSAPWSVLAGLGLGLGVHTIRLRVTDSFGLTGAEATSLTILPPVLHWQGDINANWSVSGNWLENIAPVDGTTLVFDSTTAGFTRSASVNDLTGLDIERIETFNTLAPNLQLTGNAITLANGLLTAGSGTTRVSLGGVTLTAPQSFQVDSSPASTIIDSAINLGAATLTIDGIGFRWFQGVISGSGGLEILGTAGTRFEATSTYSGPTEISGGGQVIAKGTLGDTVGPTTVDNSTLVIGFNSTSNELTTLVGANSVLQGDDGAVQAGDVVLAVSNSAKLRVNSLNGTFRITGEISGNVGATPLVVEAGAGMSLVLEGANSYVGGTTVQGGGRLALGASGVLPDASALTVAAGSTLDLDGFNETIGSLAGAGAVALDAGTLTVGGDNTSTTYSGVMSGTGGLVKQGSGTFTLSGANTYLDATNITAGTVVAATSGALGGAASGTTVSGTGLLSVSAGVTTAEPLTINTGRQVVLQDGAVASGAVQLAGTMAGRVSSAVSGPITLTGGGAGFTMLSSPGTFEISGPITDGAATWGVSVLTTSSTAVVRFSNPSNAYDGTTLVTGVGALELGASDVLPNSSAVSIDAGAKLDLAGFNDTVASVAGGGAIALGAGTLTTGDAGSTTFSGTISGAGGLVKQGSGQWTLNGGNSYSGSTTVQAGTLVAGSSLALGNVAGSTVVTGSGLLSVSNGVSLAEPLVVHPGRLVVLQDAASSSGEIQLAGTIAGRVGSVASGPITLTGPNAGFTMLSSPGTFTISGSITDGAASYGVTTLTTSSLAVIRLTNNANLYEGSTNVTGPGSLELGANEVLPDTSELTVEAGSILNVGGFVETVASLNNSGTVRLGGGTLSALGTAVSSGTIEQSGTIGGTSFVNSGHIKPGSSPGSITMLGDYSQAAAGTLDIEIGGTAAGTQYDQLSVVGTVSLDGALSVSLINGFVPSFADSFVLVANDGVDAVVGTFAGHPEGDSFTLGGVHVTLTYHGGDGNDVELTANWPPVADAGGPYSIDLGNSLSLDASGSFDPDAGDSIVSYEWDLDNDGQFDDWSSASPLTSVPWSTIEALGLLPGALPIAVRVSDTVGTMDDDGSVLNLSSVLAYDVPANGLADDYTLRRSGSNLQLVEGASTVLVNYPLAPITSIELTGADGEVETLVVDYAFGGVFAIPTSLSGGVGGGDVARVVGGAFSSGNVVMTGPTDATLQLDASSLTVAGIESVQLGGATGQLLITLSNAADTVSFNDAGGAGNGESLLANTSSTLPEFIFQSPASWLGLDTGNGADVVAIAGFDSTFVGNLDLNGTTDDALSITGAVQVGQVIGDAQSIQFNGSMQAFDVLLTAHSDLTINAALTAGEGGVDLIAGRSIFVNANVQATGGGDITLAANSGTNAGVVDALRAAGVAQLTMAAGTVVDSASGSLVAALLESGNGLTHSASGDITLGSLVALAGHVLVRNQGLSAGSDIAMAAGGVINSLTMALDANGSTASVGASGVPIALTSGGGTPTVEARGGSGGVYLVSTGDLTIGGASYGGLSGVATSNGGPIDASAVVGINIVETVAGAGNVRLFADSGAISGANGATLDVLADELYVEAYLGIDLDTQATSLVARTGIAGNGGGTLRIDEADGLVASDIVVTGAGQDAFVATTTGDLVVTALISPDGATLSAAAGAIVDGNAAGVVNVTAPNLNVSATTGITLDVVAATVSAAAVSGVGAGLSLRDLAGGLTVSSAAALDGPIALRTDGGSLTAVSVSAGAGNIELRSTVSGSVFLGNVTTTGLLTVASAGAIEEFGADPALDVVAGSLALTAASTIGAAGLIELDVATLTTAVAGSGPLTITDASGGLNVTGLVQAPGTVTISAPETAALTDDLSFASTAVVRSIGGAVAISAGDDITIAAGALVHSVSSSITLSMGVANTDGQIAIASIDGLVQSPVTLNVVGGSGPDHLRFLPNASFTQFPSFSFNGGTGTDQLMLDRSVGSVFNVNTGGTNATNQGTTSGGGLANGTFSAVESLAGGSGNDTFAFTANRSVSGVVDGRGGTDTLNYAGRTAAVTVNLQTGSATATGGIASIENFIGGANAGDSLVGANTPNSWTLTGANSGNVNGSTTYSAIESLTGGADVDTFTLGAAGSLAGTLNGGGGADMLIGRDIANAWNLTGANAGNLNGSLTFASIENLTGGSDVDSFNFSGNTRSVSGVVAGSGGVDTLNYAGRTSAVTVDLETQTATATGGISGLEALVGGSGSDTLIGANIVNVWTISGSGAGDLNGSFSFSALEHLTGGIDSDRFKFATSGVVTGVVSGGGGSSDILDYGLRSASVSINLQTGAATSTGSFSSIEHFLGSTALGDALTGPNTANTWGITQIDGGGLNAQYSFAGIENLNGGTGADTMTVGVGVGLTGAYNAGTGSDTLVGPNGFANQWSLTGANAGNLNGLLAFSAVENLTGGSGNDQFSLNAGSSLAETLDGAGGTNELNYAMFGAAVTIDLGSGVTTAITTFLNVTSFVGSGLATDTLIGENLSLTWTITGAEAGTTSTGSQFSAIERITGGSSADYFEFAPAGSLTGPLQGGGGNDTLAGKDVANAWSVTADNAGTLNSSLSFTSVEALVGGDDNDSFVFSNGASLANSVDGALGVDSLQYAAYTAAITIDLQNATFTSGAESYGFAGIETLQGGGASTDRLVGPDSGTAWYLTGANAGDVNGELTFSAIERLSGGSATDDFVLEAGASASGLIDGGGGFDTLDYTAFVSPISVNLNTSAATSTGGFANLESVIGGGAVDTLTGANVANDWSITGFDEGAVNGLNFVSFENLVGGTAADTFSLLGGASSGSIQGGTGSDTLVAGGGTHLWSIPTTNNAGSLDGLAFSSIENLTGGADDDQFIFGAGRSVSGVIDGAGGADTLNMSAYTTSISVNLQANTATVATGGIASIEEFLGGSGADTLTGPDAAMTWNITGVNEGTLNGAGGFQAFENLVGGSAADSFLFASGGSITGTVSGNGGVDSVDYSATSGPVTVNLLTGYVGFETLVGSGSANDTLVATNSSNAYLFTGANSGSINGAVNFASFENQTSGTGADTFTFASGGSISGALAGGGGVDTLDYAAQSAAMTINLQAATASLTGGIASIENVIGGSGVDTLIGANVNQTWAVSATNAGSVGGVTFAAIENLTGGSATDTFHLAAGFVTSGTVTGGSGADALVGPNSAGTWSLTTSNSGSATWSGVGSQSFSQFETLTAGTALDILLGTDANSTWNLSGANAGSIAGSVAFSGVESLMGGAGNDTFVFVAAASLAGSIAAGAGTNALDYSALTTNVLVDLSLSSATSIGGTVAGIRNVTTGGGSDTLIGDNNANVLQGNNGDDTIRGNGGPDTLVGGQGSNLLFGGDDNDSLTGGTGRDLLVGGNGVDNLNGGGGDDILIGGRTTHDTNSVALDAIMAEWRSGASYANRVNHLTGALGGGLNGSTLLNNATVLDDGGAPDVMTGSGGRDLFYALLGNDIITDLNNGGPENLFGL